MVVCFTIVIYYVISSPIVLIPLWVMTFLLICNDDKKEDNYTIPKVLVISMPMYSINIDFGIFTLMPFQLIAIMSLIVLSKMKFNIKKNVLFFTILIFVCFLLSLINAQNQLYLFRRLFNISMVMLGAIEICALVRTKKDLINLLSIHLQMAFLIAILGCVEFVLGFMGIIEPKMTNGIYPRITVTFTDPNILSEYLLTSIPILLLFIFYKKYIFTKRKTWIILITSIVALLCTFSRGGMISAYVIIFVLSFCSKKKYAIYQFIIIGGGLIIFRESAFLERLFEVGQDYSSLARLEIYENAARMFMDNPILGVGLNNFSVVYSSYLIEELEKIIPFAHNIYVEVLVETGIVGFCAFMSMIIVSILGYIKTLKYCKGNPEDKIIILGTLFGLLAVLMQNLTVGGLVQSFLWVFIFIGLIIKKIYIEENGNDIRKEKTSIKKY